MIRPQQCLKEVRELPLWASSAYYACPTRPLSCRMKSVMARAYSGMVSGSSCVVLSLVEESEGAIQMVDDIIRIHQQDPLSGELLKYLTHGMDDCFTSSLVSAAHLEVSSCKPNVITK